LVVRLHLLLAVGALAEKQRVYALMRAKLVKNSQNAIIMAVFFVFNVKNGGKMSRKP